MTRWHLELVRADDGQDLAEYGLLVSLIALIVFAGVTAFGQALLGFWMRISGAAWPW